MKRFLRLWLVLCPALVIATVAISVAGFRHVDLTFDYFVQLTVVPVIQAAVLAGAGRGSGAVQMIGTIGAIARHPLVVPVLAMDAALLSSGWILRTHPLWGLSGFASVHTTWIGTKAIGASAFLLYGARRAATSPQRRPARRIALVAGFAACVLALGVNAFWPWIERVPTLLLDGRPLLVRWLVAYGVLFTAWLAAALAAADALRASRPHAAWLLEAAVGAAFASAIVLVLSGYQRQYPAGVWLAAARTGASLSASFLLMGGIVAAVPVGRPEPARDHPAP